MTTVSPTSAGALLAVVLALNFGLSMKVGCYAGTPRHKFNQLLIVQNIETVYKHLSELEQKHIGTTFQNEIVTERLSRLEQKILGRASTEESAKKRLDILLLSTTNHADSKEKTTTSTVNKVDNIPKLSHGVRKISFEHLMHLKVSSSQPIMVHIHADWAAPSRAMIPVFAELAKESDDIFVQIDADTYSHELANSDLIGKLQAVPVFVRLEKSTVVGKIEGADEQALSALCRSHSSFEFGRELENRLNKLLNSNISAVRDTRINFKMSPSGKVIDDTISIYNSSGNQQLDGKMVDALKKLVATPVPSKKALSLQIYCQKNTKYLKVKNTGVGLDQNLNFAEYVKYVQLRIKSRWAPQKNDMDKVIVITFSIRSDGSIYDVRTLKTSTSTEANLAATRALYSAAPFRPFPNDYPDQIKIEFTFDYGAARSEDDEP